MWPPKVILHPTDFSSCSQRAFDLACDISHQHNATVIVTHAHYPTTIAFGDAPMPLVIESQAEAQFKLDQIPARPGVTVQRQLQLGTAVEWCILQAARDAQADLIVMATHGSEGYKRAALGSVAEQVVRRADCPVLLIHPVNAARHMGPTRTGPPH